MKQPKLFLLSIPFLLYGLIAATPPHTDKFNVDAGNSKVEWYAEKVTGKHNGIVNVKSGTINNDHGKMSGTIVMDMQSIAVTDLEGKYKTKLENHLKSDDFFSVEKNPTATLNIKSMAPMKAATEDGNNFSITGDLTIKGITHEIIFPASVRFEGTTMTAKGEAIIDRSKYNVRYGSPSFFDDLGDKAIYDEFKLVFNVTAGK